MEFFPLFNQLLKRLDEQVQPWVVHMGAEAGPTLSEAFSAKPARDPEHPEHPLVWLMARPELTHWAAWSEASRRHWSPIEQGYTEFLNACPDAEPYLLLTPRQAFEDVFRKLHGQLQRLRDGH